MNHLTRRESEILRLIGQARSSAQIARMLNISIHTVGNHRKHICRKLGLHTTAELVAFALSDPAISPPRPPEWP